MQRRYITQYGKDPPSFQETGCVLQRKEAVRPSTSQEDVDRSQEAFFLSPQKIN
jgi:hypothetical protein